MKKYCLLAIFVLICIGSNGQKVTKKDVTAYTNPVIWADVPTQEMRDAVDRWIAEVAPELGYSCTAPPWIEVGLRKKDGNLLVQLVERSFEWRNDLYPTNSPIEITLRLKNRPEKILLQPGNREVKWTWENSTLTAEIPLGEVKMHSILEINRGL